MNDDLVFEVELVKQIEVNIDYILMLVERYHESNMQDKTIEADINRAISSSMELRSKRDLIEQFIRSLTVDSDIDKDWQAFIARKREQELDELIAQNQLKPEEARAFVARAFEDGTLETGGTVIQEIMQPVSRFSPEADYAGKKRRIIDALQAFFNRFFGMGS